jgi:methyl-accepting chemotaxis protein
LIEDLRAAAEDIAEQARDISSVSSVLVEQASGLSASSASAVASIESVAQNSDELTAAIRSVGSNAQAAQGVALATADSISTLEPGIDRLTHEVDAARDILAMVSKIASQSNLLALNASIEAARSGDAGRGFAVVAGEMKQMASATGRATNDIAAKLAGIVSAATAFRALIETSTTHADKIKASSSAIFAAVEQQQVATDAIADGADRMLAKAIDTDSRSRTLTEVAETNSSIATNATVLAHKLGQGADELWGRMHDLLGELRAA